MVKAILAVLRTGGAWRFVPHDLPPWGIVTDTSEAMIYVAMMHIMVRRIAVKTPF